MTEHRIAYVVPTKDRPVDLEKLLISLSKQTAAPSQIIIVDGSDEPVEHIVNKFGELPLTYVREYPPSLARQRNAGMAALQDNINVAGYLDDDVELEPDATQHMIEFWNQASMRVGGASFSVLNQPVRRSGVGWFSNFFAINSNDSGRVLSSGFSTSIIMDTKDAQTEWLFGGATLWRRDIINEYKYDEWYIGHGYLEDLDYSYRVSQNHQLWIVSKAKVWHWSNPILGKNNIILGRQQIINRIYFVNKIRKFNYYAMCWGLFGQLLRNGIESLFEGNSNGAYRFWGNLLGLRDVMLRGTQSLGGNWK